MKRHHRIATASALLSAVAIAAPVAAAPTWASNVQVDHFVVTDAPFGVSNGVAFDSESGRLLATERETDSVVVIDATTERVIRTVDVGINSVKDWPQAIGIDEAGRRAYVLNSQSDSVSVIDLTSFTVVREIAHDVVRGIGDSPGSIAFDRTRHLAYVTNFGNGPGQGSVSVIDTMTMTVVTVIPHDSASGIGSGVRDIAVDETLHRAFAANGQDGTVSVIDTTTNTVMKVIPKGPTSIPTPPHSIAVDQERHRAFVANTIDGTISVIDTSTLTVETVLHDVISAEPGDLVVDPVGDQLWVTSNMPGNSGEASAIDLRSLKVLARVGVTAATRSITIDADDRRAFAVHGTRLGSVWDLDTTAAVSRRSGTDRFGTSAALSASEFAVGVGVVYVTSGENFPDALSASAAAGRWQGPVLLATRDGIPPAVGVELARLKPKRIVVVGGTSAIGAEVERQLGTYGPVTRLAGADRFEVSAAVSKDAFKDGAAIVTIASGENFPDALSGGAVAGHDGGPLLLVRRDGIPAAIKTELARFKPDKIRVLGGVNAVGEAVAAELATIAPVVRSSGADRFATSAAASADAFPANTDVVYVAAGTAFPDALSGGPVAAPHLAPVLLVRPDAIPSAIDTELKRLNPKRIVVLGGPNAVTGAVYEQLRAYTGH
ncbi:cell wall-binding repeat-containing protein [Herbiconiux sp. CPCC 205716]|uniref:Cell wall-binding repeat-containing protein n=1 Tax=Herbiconiux gentiana TaxID=2970912 RepID=A0ABT2GCM3_9MICO|nr:cell wall-binding repeat-containing protein [Herbiconiux gentiana]MCS5713965.1 cell wall-binding repeat-containing protein [Herbiconiux gentiana]